MAHLMRRAGFGESREQLEERIVSGYEASVEELLHPEKTQPVDLFELFRYQPWAWKPGTVFGMGHASWTYTALNTQAPLQEKMALFWHGIFATGVSKVDHWDEVTDLIDTFRENGLGSFKDLLIKVAKNPAMIYWLDNNENHADRINENWGRELLELFSMGVGNYTETDVRECSRAFTGWTMSPKLPRFPMGRFDWFFEYRDEDHDQGEKTFLGHTGNLSGQDIIEIICKQPATIRFIARHLYNFFVADEPQVPAWSVKAPIDPAAVNILADALSESDLNIRYTLRVLFNSEFFKNARFKKLKSPAEVVIGTLRLVGGSDFPGPGFGNLSRQTGYMGQELLNPPSVEGWHTGIEWINSGSLMRRTNFFTDIISMASRPGIKKMLAWVRKQEINSAEEFVDVCLSLFGPLEIDKPTHEELTQHVNGKAVFENDRLKTEQLETKDIVELLQLIVSLREYQFA